MQDKINFIPFKNINFEKWDNVLQISDNAFIYATSPYLNAMCEQWDALVMNDYEYIMPLPSRNKYSISYIYLPAFTQQLGIFSNKDITPSVVDAFISAIPQKFKYCELNLNHTNTTNVYTPLQRKNYLLRLSLPYQQLQDNYSRSAKRNINKAKEEGISIKEHVSVNEIIEMHRKRFKDKVGVTAGDYLKFGSLTDVFLLKKQCYTFGAYNKDNELIAGSIYLLYKQRLTFILNGNSPESLQCGATHLLKDYVIEKFSASGLVLDFEGSDSPNFSRFYEQFGAKEIEYYPFLVLNRLPFFLKWLKR